MSELCLIDIKNKVDAELEFDRFWAGRIFEFKSN